MLRSVIYFLLGSIILTACIEPYRLPEGSSGGSYLVVDGFLDSGTGKAQVKLTRSRGLSETGSFEHEENAIVRIEDQFGGSQLLSESDKGIYTGTSLIIDPSEKYRLTIQAASGKIYASTFVQIIQTPPIDSVTWRPTSDGVDFLVNTHNDVPNGSRHYLWRFDETWEYNASHYSAFKFESGVPIARTKNELLYTCWGTNSSTDILVKSTERLSENIVSQFPVNFIPVADRRLGVKYSILVHQVGLSKEAYEFWSKLEQTTENVGGLFDPQPGQVLGNLECISDPKELVLGIFHAANTVEQRLFLEFKELPDYLQFVGSRPYCLIDSIAVDEIENFQYGGNLLLGQITEGITVIGYTYTSMPCADCRYEGGELNKPAFWE